MTRKLFTLAAVCGLLLVSGCASNETSSYLPISDWADTRDVARQQAWYADNCTSRFFGNDKMCSAAHQDISDARELRRQAGQVKAQEAATPSQPQESAPKKNVVICAEGHSCASN